MERMAEGAVPHVPAGGPGADPTTVAPSVRLQMLATEHWSLLATRSMGYQESFSRAGMFLSVLSGAVVALALVAQAMSFGSGFELFALVLLPVVLFVGVGTALRLDNANYHEVLTVAGMNRIRANYVRMAPALKEVFVMGTTDDLRGITLTVANAPDHGWLADVLASTPALLAVLNSMLASAIVGLLLLQFGMVVVVSLAAAVAVFLVSFVLQALNWRRQFNALVSSYTPVYPGEPE
jgi:hypothetical protein